MKVTSTGSIPKCHLDCLVRGGFSAHLLEGKAPKSSSDQGFMSFMFRYKGNFAPDKPSGLFTVRRLRSDFTAAAFGEAWHLQLTPEGI